MKASILWLIGAAAVVNIALAAQDAATSTSSYLTEQDKNRLTDVLKSGFSLTDAASAYYAVTGYKLLQKELPTKPKVSEICEYLVRLAGSDQSPENLFYIVSAWKTLGSCKALPKLTEVLTRVIEKESSTIPDLYHAAYALTALSQNLPEATLSKLAKAVQAALKKDDSLSNLGYTFHVAALMGPAGSFALDKIEDAIVQADEVDGRFLQFEGGLAVTSLVVEGIAKLSASLKKEPPVKGEQIVKLANYLLSRRSVQTPRGVVKLLSALAILANNELNRPICITLADGGLVVSSQQPLVSVKVCDILGRPLLVTPTIVATSATRTDDHVVVLSKRNFTPSPKEKALFTMNFMDIKPPRGFYKIAVSAGSVSNVVTVKVLSEVRVNYLEIGTVDADLTTQPKMVKVAYPDKLAHKIEADSQQKLVVRFSLHDTANDKPIRVHQAFVRLYSVSKNSKQGREIVFVAEPDASNVYRFDMPLSSAAETFAYKSGDYNIELIVGDATLSNSFQWTLATVGLKFPELSDVAAVAAAAAAKDSHKQNPYAPKPEIKHMFREPEKRPPVFVSNLFTGLCLAPILLLLGLWAKLRVNVSKFPFSLSAVVFHLGLASIFILFGIFWLRLDMFVTLRYLLGLGVVTFLAGSKLLSQIAHSHKLSR